MAITKVETPLRTLLVSLSHAGLSVYNVLVADLVGSTLSDPYLSYSAALFALAGPLHGLVLKVALSNCE